MNISHQSVLNKIEMEVRQARQAEKSDEIKRHVHTIKALCDLVLESADGAGQPSSVRGEHIFSSMPQQTLSQPTISQEEKLATEDGANGDSLFDF
ncbi:YwdI family protein [Bacillus sp. REN10]|uniref:YwdI family protein n=1 Tax=Bacillus sp. REN10 TaxID=2782541 RepID=UPI00193BF6DC|nr:YwdI family protein [Bacillus sp. REN10]